MKGSEYFTLLGLESKEIFLTKNKDGLFLTLRGNNTEDILPLKNFYLEYRVDKGYFKLTYKTKIYEDDFSVSGSTKKLSLDFKLNGTMVKTDHTKFTFIIKKSEHSVNVFDNNNIIQGFTLSYTDLMETANLIIDLNI